MRCAVHDGDSIDLSTPESIFRQCFPEASDHLIEAIADEVRRICPSLSCANITKICNDTIAVHAGSGCDECLVREIMDS